MEASGDRVRDSDGQKVRYDNNVVHRAKHAHDDARPLPAERSIQQRPRLPEHDIHCDIQQRVSHEDLRATLPLLRGALEPLRFCCRYIINIR